MRRLLPLVLPLALLFAPSAAEAGPGAVLKAIAKIGKLGAKGGKIGGLAGKGLKGASAFKGAKVLGATVAAREVFQHTATDGARVGLYLADDGAGALKVITQTGDEMVHTVDDLGRYVDDLDAMADVAPEAGVDLFLDADVLSRLDGLKVGPNTRLWLANVEGPSLPLRKAADGVAEVAVATDSTGAGRLWFRVTSESVQLALRLSRVEGEADEIVVIDPDCGELPGARVAAEPNAALATASGTVVLLTADPSGDPLEAIARDNELDLVVVPGLDLCGPEGLTERGAGALDRARAASTVGELWAIGATATAPLVVTDVREGADWLAVRGASLAAFHRVAVAPEDDEPPPWVIGLGLGIGVLVVGLFWWRKRDEESG